MIIKTKELINIKDSKTYDIDIKDINFNDSLFIKRINDVKGYLEFYYDDSDSLFMHYDLDYSVVVPGSLSPEDVTYNDHIVDDEHVCFNEDEDGFYIKDECEDIELVKSIIYPLIPIKTENSNDNMHIEGDGWTITSEKEYAKMKKEKVDPRLEVLKKYKEEN